MMVRPYLGLITGRDPTSGVSVSQRKAVPNVSPQTTHRTVRCLALRSGGVHDGDDDARSLDSAVARFGDRPALSMRRDDGSLEAWTYREFERRARIAAWRLRALGLQPGDRILTWSPSCPELAATYFGAMRAGPSQSPRPAHVARRHRRRRRVGRHLVGSSWGRATMRPIPEFGRPRPAPDDDRRRSSRRSDEAFPADWEKQLAGWEQPKPEDVFELIFTSGTTSAPKGVMLGHDNVVASVRQLQLAGPSDGAPPGVAPAAVPPARPVRGALLATSVGADIHYVRQPEPAGHLRRAPRTPCHLDGAGPAVHRPVLEQPPAGGRQARPDAGRRRLRPVARLFADGRPAGHVPVHPRAARRELPPVPLGRRIPAAGGPAGVGRHRGHDPPGLRLDRDRTGSAADARPTTVSGRSAGRPRGCRSSWPRTAEIPVQGADAVPRLLERPGQDRRGVTPDGWYRSGDIGHFDDHGRLILSGRKKDIIVLPNGFNVYPEDIENALHIAGSAIRW